jgi:hypothetical protein
MQQTGAQVILSQESARYWRIRMKYSPDGEDVTKQAWRERVIGIWYGAWNAPQFERTMLMSTTEAAHSLTKFNVNAKLNWEITSGFVSTARRFWTISDADWVFTYFDDAIHLARVSAPIETEPHVGWFNYLRNVAQSPRCVSVLVFCLGMIGWIR